jgi:hypothetical protein
MSEKEESERSKQLKETFLKELAELVDNFNESCSDNHIGIVGVELDRYLTSDVAAREVYELQWVEHEFKMALIESHPPRNLYSN